MENLVEPSACPTEFQARLAATSEDRLRLEADHSELLEDLWDATEYRLRYASHLFDEAECRTELSADNFF